MANEFIARNGLIAQNNTTVTGSLIVTGGITGSLSGSAISASYSDSALSASYGATSSYSTALGATIGQNAAGTVQLKNSAGTVISSLNVSTITSSLAYTASLALSLSGSSTGSLLGTASLATTASYALTASYVTTAQTASYVDATNITTGVLNNSRLPSQINVTGVSASFTGSLTGALTGTASYASQALSSSYASTASYATFNVSAGTTSNNVSNIVLSNSNNVSFGLNGSTITANAPIIVSAGTTSNSLSSIVFGNVVGLSFGMNGSTITADAAINFSAGSTSNNIADSLVFSNSNGVSFGMNGSTITANISSLVFSNSNNVSFGINAGTLTATATVASSLTNINVSAGTTSNNLSALVFSNSNGVSFGLNGSTITATAVAAANINVSAGTTSNNLSALVFSNTNNISFGLNSNTVTATYQQPVKSYWDNIPSLDGSTAFAFAGGSSQHVLPFFLPYDVSVSYLRMLLSNNLASTTFATTANASYTLNESLTYWANIYSLGTGANSNVLQQIFGSSTAQTYQIRAEVGAASNNQTVSHNMTYPGLGGTNSNFATNYNVNAASVVISTTHLTQFNAGRALDIPFATSLPAGAYWIAFQKSSATATTGGQLSNVTLNHSLFGVSQVNSNFPPMGIASNASSHPINYGLGQWSTNTVGTTSNSIQITNISSTASQPKAYFALFRIA